MRHRRTMIGSGENLEVSGSSLTYDASFNKIRSRFLSGYCDQCCRPPHTKISIKRSTVIVKFCI